MVVCAQSSIYDLWALYLLWWHACGRVVSGDKAISLNVKGHILAPEWIERIAWKSI